MKWHSIGFFIFLYNTQLSANGKYIKKDKNDRPNRSFGGHQIEPGLDLMLDYPTPLFESAQTAMS